MAWGIAPEIPRTGRPHHRPRFLVNGRQDVLIGPHAGATGIGGGAPQIVGQAQDLVKHVVGSEPPKFSEARRRPCRWVSCQRNPRHLIQGAVRNSVREGGRSSAPRALDHVGKALLHQMALGDGLRFQALEPCVPTNETQLKHGIWRGREWRWAASAIARRHRQELPACSRHKSARPPTDRPRPQFSASGGARLSRAPTCTSATIAIDLIGEPRRGSGARRVKATVAIGPTSRWR